MLKVFLKRINNKKGFTLVELVVVMAILAILAAIAVPKFTDQTAAAKKAACTANKRSIESALMLYYADNENEFPTEKDLSQWTGEENPLKEYGFEEVPKCPSDGKYTMDDDGRVTCKLHDEEDGNEDGGDEDDENNGGDEDDENEDDDS